jgi:hypothetical protein
VLLARCAFVCDLAAARTVGDELQQTAFRTCDADHKPPVLRCSRLSVMASALPSASSGFAVARDTLAVRLTLPLAGCVEDFHLQVHAPCRAHKENATRWPGRRVMVEAAGQLIHLFRDRLDYAFILHAGCGACYPSIVPDES